MSSLIVGITLDPNGTYVGRDEYLNLFWYSPVRGVWVYLDPENQGVEIKCTA